MKKPVNLIETNKMVFVSLCHSDRPLKNWTIFALEADWYRGKKKKNQTKPTS